MKNLIVIIGIAIAVVHTVYSCKCIMPKSGDEVCGSDGVTYDSSCILFCAGFYRNQTEPCLTTVSNGKCNTSPCICTDTCNYVCGSNGETYGNDCTLKCAQKFNSTLTKVKDGKCDHLINTD